MAFRNTKIRAAKALIAAVGLLAGALTGMALAATSHTTLKTAHNSSLGKTIVVDSRGRTVYELKPETAHHLLCTSKQCLQFWPPVTVHSAKTKLSKATGVKGKLGILHRKGFLQVTLGGVPLYRFAKDTAKGQANGNGIMGFGGTWHVVTASSHKTSSSSTTTGSTTTTPGYY
jgi:predicted lipoprotein with Yx(FWY)xxD motif